MQIGTALFLIAVGAILRFAVNADTEGFSINTAGTILMVVGVVGLLIAALFLTMRRDSVRRETVVDRERDLYPR